MTRCKYKNHQTGETSVTYWMTTDDAHAWLKSQSSDVRKSEYGCYTLSDYETASLARV